MGGNTRKQEIWGIHGNMRHKGRRSKQHPKKDGETEKENSQMGLKDGRRNSKNKRKKRDPETRMRAEQGQQSEMTIKKRRRRRRHRRNRRNWHTKEEAWDQIIMERANAKTIIIGTVYRRTGKSIEIQTLWEDDIDHKDTNKAKDEHRVVRNALEFSGDT